MSGVKGVDTSHWQGVPTDDQINCLWAYGARYWIPGLQDPNIFIPTIRKLAAQNRWWIEGYEYLYQSKGPMAMVQESVQQLKAGGVFDDVKKLWLDYEQGAEMWGDAEVDQALGIAEWVEASGTTTGLYSSQGWLKSNISAAALPRLAVLPLWLAYWDNHAGESWPYPSPPLGGWTEMHTKQYAGDSGSACGITVDWNWRPQEVWDNEVDDMADPEAFIRMLQNSTPDQLNRMYKFGLKYAIIDLWGELPPEWRDPADVGKPVDNDEYIHIMRDTLKRVEEANGGGRRGVTEAEARRMAREEIAASVIHPRGGLG